MNVAICCKEDMRIFQSPDHGKWIVTLWHFGTDSLNYKKDNYCVTWQQRQNVLSRTYNKNMRRGERHEIQERPQKPYADTIKDKMDQTTMTTESNSTED
jgi:hypothetical protein